MERRLEMKFGDYKDLLMGAWSRMTSLEKEIAQPCSTVTSWPIVVIFREDGTVTSGHQPVALSGLYCALPSG